MGKRVENDSSKEKVKKVQELRRSNAATYKDPRPRRERTRVNKSQKAIKDSLS